MTRRSFLGRKPEELPALLLNLRNKLGKVPLLFPFTPQELPEVPAPAEKITLLGGLTPYTGTWGYAQAAHLLRRTGFGLKKAEMDTFLTLNMNSAVNKVLNTPSGSQVFCHILPGNRKESIQAARFTPGSSMGFPYPGVGRNIMDNQ